MLYLLQEDGRIEELPEAFDVWIDEKRSSLVCYDAAGNEVACYPRLSVSMYSKKPSPRIPEPDFRMMEALLV